MRKTFYISSEFPELTHANGSKTLADMGTLDQNKEKYKWTYLWWTAILGQTNDTFQRMTLPSAVLNNALWAGNGSGFTSGVTCTSRNNIEQIPGGQLKLNVAARILQGRFIGGGTSIGLNGNASTELIYDHARWIDPASVRALILSANWGTNDYLESTYISDVRLNGNAPNWFDKGYEQHGIALRMMGETSAIGRVYVDNCNGHGVWVNGAGPGKINHLTTFDNNLAGLYVTNDKTGAATGNSLGMLQVDHISGDNNAWVVLNRSGCAMHITYLKNEDGLSAQRGRPKKDQVSIEAHGWINMSVDHITDAVRGSSGPTLVMNSTANKSKLSIRHYAQVSSNSDINQGRSALLADVRAKKAWRTSDQNAGELKVMSIDWTGYGTTSTFTCSEPVVEVAFSGTTRLGVGTNYASYDYPNAKPVWDPSGGTTPTTPTTPPVTPPIVTPPVVIPPVVTPPVIPPVVIVDPAPPTGVKYALTIPANGYVTTSTSYEEVKNATNITKVKLDFTPSSIDYGRILGSGDKKPGLQMKLDGFLYWVIPADATAGISGSSTKLTITKSVVGVRQSVELTIPSSTITCLFQTHQSQGGAQLGTFYKLELL